MPVDLIATGQLVVGSLSGVRDGSKIVFTLIQQLPRGTPAEIKATLAQVADLLDAHLDAETKTMLLPEDVNIQANYDQLLTMYYRVGQALDEVAAQRKQDKRWTPSTTAHYLATFFTRKDEFGSVRSLSIGLLESTVTFSQALQKWNRAVHRNYDVVALKIPSPTVDQRLLRPDPFRPSQITRLRSLAYWFEQRSGEQVKSIPAMEPLMHIPGGRALNKAVRISSHLSRITAVFNTRKKPTKKNTSMPAAGDNDSPFELDEMSQSKSNWKARSSGSIDNLPVLEQDIASCTTTSHV